MIIFGTNQSFYFLCVNNNNFKSNQIKSNLFASTKYKRKTLQLKNINLILSCTISKIW